MRRFFLVSYDISDDRRRTRILLTPEARQLRARYDEVSARMNELYFSGFSDDEIETLERFLDRILINLNGGKPHEKD